MHSLVQPNSWAVLRLPSGNLRVLQVAPNTTISLGKYGSFPTNLIIQRPYHLTYELLDRHPNENFNRLRIVPGAELYADILSDGASVAASGDATPAQDAEGVEMGAATGVEYSLVDPDSGAVVATTDGAEINAEARQTLTLEEIEALKKDGTDAGRELIAKLMLSHTAIDQKTEYSLAKYKLLKTRKYIRRFSVLPLDVPMLDYWQLEDKDPSKILDMRDEMLGLLGCWANVHFGGTDPCEAQPPPTAKAEQDQDQDGEQKQKQEQTGEDPDTNMDELELVPTPTPGRWLVVDDTGGLLVAAMAERMGILYPPEGDNVDRERGGAKNSSKQGDSTDTQQQPQTTISKDGEDPAQPQVLQQDDVAASEPKPEPIPVHEEASAQLNAPQETTVTDTNKQLGNEHEKHHDKKHHRRRDDLTPYAHANTITHIHANTQPNLSFLRYYGFDITSPSTHGPWHQPQHPLARHLMTLSWLQLLEPSLDPTYALAAPTATPEELAAWKTNRRSAFHRKRRRWARTRHTIDSTRAGEFSGLVVASVMDPISIMRHAVPLLAGGAPIAIYSQSVEALSELADCYSLARRAAWAASPPAAAEQENWPGDDDFPLNPSLVLGASVQTSRVRRWQVLPGRTHPLMSGKGGAEGYVFTAWRVRPAEGKVEARGKLRSRKRKADDPSRVAA